MRTNRGRANRRRAAAWHGRRWPAFLAGVVLALGLVPAPSLAFKGKEHISIANDGLRLALAYATAEGIISQAEAERLRGELLTPKGQESPETYGELVSAVDYVLNPVELFEQKDEIRCLPKSVQAVINRPKKGLWTKRLNHLRAAHNNEVHFGAEALNSFWAWHAAVVDAAARRGCTVDDGEGALIGLLIANAVSEHYLEDLFAPGHVATFRDTMHDIGAALIHDRFNQRGTAFRLKQEAVREHLLVLLGEDGRHFGAIEGLPADDREAATDDLRDSDRVYIYGDGGLDWSPKQGFEKRTKAQRLLMTLLAARSALDVLESYAKNEAINSFQRVLWEPQREILLPDGTSRFRLARWGCDYGYYADGWGLEGRRRAPVFDEYILYHGTALGVSLEGEGFLGEEDNGNGSFRTAYRLEVMPGFLAPGRRKIEETIYQAKNFQIGGAAGYEYVNSASHHGHGAGARLILAVPKIDMMFSALAGYRWLNQGTIQSEGIFYGVRGDLGFSLLTLYATYYFADQLIAPAGDSREDSAVAFGVSFSAPLSRFPGTAKRAGRKSWEAVRE